MSMPDPSPLKPQDAVMYALGELKGQMNAVLASQSAQAEVNAENKREHDEFRNKLSDHDGALKVLNDNKQDAKAQRSDRFTTVMLWITAAGVIASVALNFIH